MHEALNNWGVALAGQAKLKGNADEADGLFAEAGKKYAEAVRIKRDMPEPFFNLACLASDLGKTADAVSYLEEWRHLAKGARKSDIDGETDFDRIRQEPAFQEFRCRLPE
jgi:tetratricopeptide (TPR) repeat protein